MAVQMERRVVSTELLAEFLGDLESEGEITAGLAGWRCRSPRS